MAFTDLPKDLPELSLTEATLVADVLDLVISEADRHRGSLAVLVCDDEARLLAPVVVADMPEQLSAGDREQTLATVVAATGGTGSVHVAVARADGLSLREGDHAWARAAATVCASGPRLLGVHVVTVDGSRQVPLQGARTDQRRAGPAGRP